MLEIFVVVYLSHRIKKTLQRKGQKVGLWQLWVLLVWLGLEFAGAFISIMLGSSLFIAMLSGILCAIGGSIALQQYAQSLPDVNANNWMDNIGKEDEYK